MQQDAYNSEMVRDSLQRQGVFKFTQISTPRGAKTSRGIELKIAMINNLGGLTKQAKFQICVPSGVVWVMG